jgi:threonyl-tRNA synthetase
MVVLGDREVEAKEISVRLRNGELFAGKSIQELIDFAKEKVAAKTAI